MAIKVKYRCPVENCICQTLTLENNAALVNYRKRLAPCVFHPDKMMEIIVDDELPWVVEIANGTQFWYEEVEYLPSIIAHEYWRLRELCKSNQPYAAYFQARDVIEVILKFEVLSVCAWARSMQDDEFRNTVACEITKKNISLGEWRELAQRIKKFYIANPADMPPALWHGLNKILEEYYDQKMQLIKWRNDNVGHGALGFAEDEEFKAKLENVIKNIHAVLNKVGKHLQEQYMKMGDKILIGHENARKLVGKRTITMETKKNDGSIYSFSLDPYIVLRENSIFFFDNQFGPTFSELQCYTNGHRPNVTIPEFIELYRINSAHHKYEASETRNVTANDRTAADDFFLSCDLDDRIAIKPDVVCDWLSKQIKSHSHGVYRILMPRASGKSTLAERLNMINNNPWIVDDTADVRTYHIARTQLRGIDDLLNEIEELWCEAHPGDRSRWKPNTHLVEMMHDNHLSAGDAVVAFMREYMDCGICKKQKVVLVIDGLDEITAENKRIWEMIPSPNTLVDGIHIICLGRLPSELTKENKAAESYQTQLNKQQITSNLVINKKDPSNLDFLRSYLVSQNLPDVIDLELLMKKADYRILYLVLLSSLIKDGMTPEMIGDSLAIVRKYLSVLFAKYGEKQGIRLHELLTILSTLGMRESLSMHEIAYLLMGSCNAEISYALFGMMRDVSPLLSVSRGYISQGTVLTGVNRFTFHDKDIALAVKQVIEDNTIVSIIERMICFSISIAEEGIIIQNESENACLVVFAHMDYLLGFLKGNRSRYENSTSLGLICRYINLCEPYTQHVTALHRQLLAMDYCTEAYNKNKKPGQPFCNIEVSENTSFSGDIATVYIYKTYADTLEKNLQIKKAEEYYLKAMDLLSTVNSQEDSAPLQKLKYEVYSKCAGVLASDENCDPNKAIRVEELSIETLKALGDSSEIPNVLALASAMSNLGQKHRIAGHIDKSIECYEDALSLLSGMDPLMRDEEVYATTLMNYGVALREKHQFENAIANYKKSIDIFEKLCINAPVQVRTRLIIPYNNIAYCYREYAKDSNMDTQLLLNAKDYYEKSIEVIQSLCDSGYMMDIHNQRGNAFGNYAIVLMLLKETITAKKYFKNALDEYETVIMQGTPLYKDGLATTCLNYQKILDPKHDNSELLRIQRIQQKVLPAGSHWKITASTAEVETMKNDTNNSIHSSRAPHESQPLGGYYKQIPYSADEASINDYMAKSPHAAKMDKPLGILADGSAIFAVPAVYSRIEKLYEKLRKQDYRNDGTVFVWVSLKLKEEIEHKLNMSSSKKSYIDSAIHLLMDYIEKTTIDIGKEQDDRAIIELKCKQISLIEYLLPAFDKSRYSESSVAQSIDVISLVECLISYLHDVETLCSNPGIFASGYCAAAKRYSSFMMTEDAEKYEKIASKYELLSRNHFNEIQQVSAIYAELINNFEPLLSQDPYSRLAHAYTSLEETLSKSIGVSCKTPVAYAIKIAREVFQSISSNANSSDHEILAASHFLASKLIRFGDSRDIDLAIELETEVLKQIDNLSLISDREILFVIIVQDYLAIAYYHKGNSKAAKDCIKKSARLSNKYTPWFVE